jgi:hypothetical protein
VLVYNTLVYPAPNTAQVPNHGGALMLLLLLECCCGLVMLVLVLGLVLMLVLWCCSVVVLWSCGVGGCTGHRHTHMIECHIHLAQHTNLKRGPFLPCSPSTPLPGFGRMASGPPGAHQPGAAASRVRPSHTNHHAAPHSINERPFHTEHHAAPHSTNARPSHIEYNLTTAFANVPLY